MGGMMPRGRAPLAVGVLLAAATACGRPPQPSSPAPRDSVQVGYGAQQKDKVTGAVSSMSETEVPRRPLAIDELLRGRVPGLVVLNRGNATTFRIRGTGSMLIDQEPLVIVDDVMIQEGSVGSALAGLTPNDIRQVSVLKDVASTSIYGTRGAGGVILITTKAKR